MSQQSIADREQGADLDAAISGPRSRWFALVGLPTGAALVIYFVSGVSLPIGLAVTGALVVGITWWVWRQLAPQQRAHARQTLLIGLACGVVATLLYDLSRFGIKFAFDLKMQPWEALPFFGELLTGQDSATTVARITGFGYHVANGLGFAIAYTFLFGRRGVFAGILWALVLEAATLTFYPGWLDIRSTQEFASVSMLGHVVYGAVLGGSARALLNRATS